MVIRATIASTGTMHQARVAKDDRTFPAGVSGCLDFLRADTNNAIGSPRESNMRVDGDTSNDDDGAKQDGYVTT